MLLLNYEQVKYCQVIGNIGGQLQKTLGLIYNGQVFLEAQSFSKDELEIAIKQCREEYLDHQERSQIPTLLVKGKNSIGIWMEDKRYKPDGEATFAISEIPEKTVSSSQKADRISLKQLALQMRGDNGLKIKARRHKLKLYHHCFLGNESVDWIVEQLKISRQDAIKLGQKMIDKKIFHHVLDEHQFKDEPIFYRFYEDEQKNIWTDKLV
ncbi:MAG: hypothetical protein ACFCU5_07510 [Pleurocapsa sp.]